MVRTLQIAGKDTRRRHGSRKPLALLSKLLVAMRDTGKGMTDLKLFSIEDDRMYYILYDLRKDPSLAKIHLPKEGDEGPVLLRIHPEQYFVIVQELRELC